jgi:hypothetical protein
MGEHHDWDALAVSFGRDGFIAVQNAVGPARLSELRALAESIAITEQADYPDSDKDVGFTTYDASVLGLMKDPPARPLLQRFLGDKPVFTVVWQRVGLPHSKGGVWHQDWEREFWPPAINLAVYLDDVTEENGPTLVVPGTHVLPHPEFDRANHPKQTPILGPAGTVALMFPTVWHRGSANTTDRPRRALFCYYRSAEAIRVRRPPDPEPGQGWVLGDPGPAYPHWILNEQTRTG